MSFNGSLQVLGPSKEYYESLLLDFRGTPEPIAKVGLLRDLARAAGEVIARVVESLEIETLSDEGETSAENNSSVILLLSVGGRNLLFTSDAGIPALSAAADQLAVRGIEASSISFVQVPHHGSKHNVGPSVLNRLVGPKLSEEKTLKSAFVSVSKGSIDKHPSKKVTNAFRRRGAPVCETRGRPICKSHDAPHREGWVPIEALPFYPEVEEEDIAVASIA